MTTDYTPNVNLYKWKTTDTKQTTITETASNVEKIDAKLNDHTVQLASTKKKIIIDVKDYGAVGDGVTNDTQACIDAFNFASSIENIPKVIVFPYSANPYIIDGTSLDASEANYGRLRIPSNTVIDLCGSTINMVANTRPNSSIFRADNKNNIVVKNGSLYGDFVIPNTKTGEWQFGVAIRSCKNVTIDNVKCYNMRGDGLYFGYTDVAIKNENILVNNCYVNTVWRNGISVTSGKNVIIQNTTVENTVANILGSGIDFEPDGDIEANYIENALVINCKFNNIIGTGSAIRFQYSKNCKAVNNRITNSDIGTEARQCYNIEYLKNEFINVKGIMLNGYSTGEIIFYRNTVGFYSGAPSGYNAFHFNIIGTSSAVRITNNKFISAVAQLLYVTAPLIYINGNEFSKCDPAVLDFEYLRPKGNSIVYFHSNKIIFNDGHSVYADIRVRDNSVCYIKNNMTINGSLFIVNSESGVFTTDIFNTIPTFGTYKKGDAIVNNTPSAGGYMGWVCLTAGTPGTWKGYGLITDTKTGTLTYNGDGATLTKTIPHGLSGTPTFYQVTPSSVDAGTADIKFVTADATNLTVTFKTAPISGTNNVKLTWQAEV